jgi:NAD(P)-dependent dehydrogenase (short-subunit alcohol dehydrogenase family)
MRTDEPSKFGSVKMKKVVITGANRGIGLALTQCFHQNDHEVFALCRKSSDELAELSSSSVHVVEGVDVTSTDDLARVTSEIGDIDILINNAGVMHPDNFDELDFDKIRHQFEVNTLGVLKVAKSLGEKIVAGGKMGIVSSRMGSIADNTSGGQYGYRISKASANAIGKSLANDMRPREVTVLLLHPGFVRTDMTSGRGLIETDESAKGLYQVLKNKDINETGTFWHTNGERLPW